MINGIDKTPSSRKHSPSGVLHWMKRVIKECNRVQLDWNEEAVHDLRVALRRCRSMADGISRVDPDRAWRRMKRGARELFHALGELRDAQVLEGWVRKFAPAADPVRQLLMQRLDARVQLYRHAAEESLERFDRKRWRHLAAHLAKRARAIPHDGLVAQHLALEYWQAAHDLHAQACRRRSRVAWHRVRIALKRFRYCAENFLPRRYEDWSTGLKRAQDLLGEVHDLDMLHVALRSVRFQVPSEDITRWDEKIARERAERLNEYRRLAGGDASVFGVWRAGLPRGAREQAAAMARLSAWAAFLNSDSRHSRHLADLALQLYDGLSAAGVDEFFREVRGRRLLHAAALLHDVGRSRGEKGHHKASYRLIRDLPPPMGWSADDMPWIALVARYHRGAEPRAGHEGFSSLGLAEQQGLLWLAAILRLADGLDGERDGRISRLNVQAAPEAILIRARGYVHDLFSASHLAERKHLLEAVARRPVIIRAEDIRPATVLPMRTSLAS